MSWFQQEISKSHHLGQNQQQALSIDCGKWLSLLLTANQQWSITVMYVQVRQPISSTTCPLIHRMVNRLLWIACDRPTPTFPNCVQLRSRATGTRMTASTQCTKYITTTYQCEPYGVVIYQSSRTHHWVNNSIYSGQFIQETGVSF